MTDLPTYPALPAEIAADLIRAVIEWRQASPGREQTNAWRRLKRRVDRASRDPYHHLLIWVRCTGTADAVIQGDLELRGDKLVVTAQGRRKVRERKREARR